MQKYKRHQAGFFFRILLLEAGDNDQPDPRISIPILMGSVARTAVDWNFSGHTPSFTNKSEQRVNRCFEFATTNN